MYILNGSPAIWTSISWKILLGLCIKAYGHENNQLFVFCKKERILWLIKNDWSCLEECIIGVLSARQD